MARWKGNVEKLTKSLVTQLTGFDDEDENFRLCLQFAKSNFKYHRFLDVDSHKVGRALNGIQTKFEVHSQTEKAKAFNDLTEDFLASGVFENRDFGKTDTHYRVLYLLFLLADKPITTEYKKVIPDLEQEPVDDFDWTGYLLDGESVYQGSYAESPIPFEYVSDDEDEEEEDSPQDVSDLQPSSAVVTWQGDPSLLVTVQGDPSLLVTCESKSPSQDKGSDWLTKNLVVQYWKGRSNELDTIGNHSSSNLSRDWEKYQMLTNPLYAEREKVFVTEAQVIREVLWMMSGISKLFMFRYNGSRFHLRDDLRISHLTNACVESVVQPFCRHGAQVHALHVFVQEIVSQSCQFDDISSVSMTYQAFTKTLSNFLQDLKQHLSDLEKRMIKNEEPITLSSLAVDLKEWMMKVDLVHSVYISGVAGASGLPTNSLKASHLLSVLYNTVLECDSLGDFTPDMLSLLLPMWIQTSQPCLQIIGDWINSGQLQDPMNEFVIQRNKTVKTTDDNFWENAFVLHMPKSSPNSSMLSMTLAQFPEDEQVSVAVSWAPKFLQPLIKDIVLTGKSMEVLEHLGHLSQVVDNGQVRSLYDTFISNLEKKLGTKELTSPEDARRNSTPKNLPLSVFTEQIDQQMRVKGLYDPLLRINFEAVFSEISVAYTEWEKEKELKMFCGLNTDGVQPVEVLLQNCLYPIVRERYSHICVELVRVLKEKYHLLDYLSAMRSFFLMEAGDTMYDFCTEIFDRMKSMEPWRDDSLLNLILHEALNQHYPEEANRLSVVVEVPKEQQRFPISITDCIKLSYAVPWPVDFVIGSRSQDIYNQVFSFLLQVKRVKYCLEQLRFADLQKEDILKSMYTQLEEQEQQQQEDLTRNSRVHLMQVLRFRLLYFVNSLHNYLMTRILHSTGLEFKKEIADSVDLDQVIAAHSTYIGKIHERCLLHHKVSFLKETVLKVLNLAIAFCGIWDQGVDEITVKMVGDMEQELSRCIQFLASFLNNVIKRGSFPHLESLAFSLVTSLEYQMKL